MWHMPHPSSGPGTQSGLSQHLGNGVPAQLNARWRCGVPGAPGRAPGSGCYAPRPGRGSWGMEARGRLPSHLPLSVGDRG